MSQSVRLPRHAVVGIAALVVLLFLVASFCSGLMPAASELPVKEAAGSSLAWGSVSLFAGMPSAAEQGSQAPRLFRHGFDEGLLMLACVFVFSYYMTRGRLCRFPQTADCPSLIAISIGGHAPPSA